MPDINPWDETFRRIRAVHWPECVYAPRTTAAELDAVEKELGFTLPASYRAFAQRFGLGGALGCSLPHVLPLRNPPGTGKRDWGRSVLAATEFHRTFDWTQDLDPPLDLFKRAVVFAIDGGYHTWLFDPAEVTDPERQECQIYEIPRHGPANSLATTFGEWVDYIDEHFRFDDEEDEPREAPTRAPVYKPNSADADPMEYWRDVLRHKKPPGKRSVKSWLAWHNGTILALARSIRDGQRDAFGILADALEDAGCRNPDLLHFCRHGDPDIDGVWVLRVLLGE